MNNLFNKIKYQYSKKNYFYIISLIFILSSCNQTPKNIITIGSGSKNGMYYPTAKALCKTFNKNNKNNNTICKPILSKGAELNLESVDNGHFSMGIAQANLQYNAFKGTKKFKNNTHINLRTVLGLHNEYLTIIAKKDADINSFSDLKGQKVNIGNIGSGSRILFGQMIEEMGWDLKDFKRIYLESGSGIKKVLCSKKRLADAAIYIVGHPNKSFDYILKNCDTKLVSLKPSEIKTFIKIAPNYFKKATIPNDTYHNQPHNISTFASQTILSASSKVDSKNIYHFLNIIHSNKNELITRQPALNVAEFFKKDNSKLAPLHNGVKRYFK